MMSDKVKVVYDGDGMAALLEGLGILAEFMPKTNWPTNCSHDLLTVNCSAPPVKVGPVKTRRLNELGFLYFEEDECWGSSRFGSC